MDWIHYNWCVVSILYISILSILIQCQPNEPLIGTFGSRNQPWAATRRQSGDVLNSSSYKVHLGVLWQVGVFTVEKIYPHTHGKKSNTFFLNRYSQETLQTVCAMHACLSWQAWIICREMLTQWTNNCQCLSTGCTKLGTPGLGDGVLGFLVLWDQRVAGYWDGDGSMKNGWIQEHTKI
jgi:hypothetical protein